MKEPLLSPYQQSIQKFTEQIMDAATSDSLHSKAKEEEKMFQAETGSSIGVVIKSYFGLNVS